MLDYLINLMVLGVMVTLHFQSWSLNTVVNRSVHLPNFCRGWDGSPAQQPLSFPCRERHVLRIGTSHGLLGTQRVSLLVHCARTSRKWGRVGRKYENGINWTRTSRKTQESNPKPKSNKLNTQKRGSPNKHITFTHYTQHRHVYECAAPLPLQCLLWCVCVCVRPLLPVESFFQSILDSMFVVFCCSVFGQEQEHAR